MNISGHFFEFIVFENDSLNNGAGTLELLLDSERIGGIKLVTV